MNWQQFKDHGQPIYFMRASGGDYYVSRDHRVIHCATSSKIATKHCVRYCLRWYPLYEPKELKTRYRREDGTYARVYLNYRPLKSTDEKLPFVRTWEEPGNFYHVFGY